MKKYTILFLSLFLLVGLIFSDVYAQENNQDVIDIEGAEEVLEETTLSDLGIEDPGLLPSSPFYFIKNWRRGFQRLFTFNEVAQVELELRFANEEAAEAKKLEEQDPGNVKAIRKAFENFQRSHDLLLAKLEALKENSENPNVDRLLNRLVEKSVRHERLFDELRDKFEDKDELRNAIEKAKEKLEDSLTKAFEKDKPEKFISRLDKFFENSKGGDLKHFHSLRLIDRLQDRSSEELRPYLDRFREKLSDRLENRLGQFVEKRDLEDLERIFKRLPGNDAHRASVLEEIRGRSDESIREKLEKSSASLEKEIVNSRHILESAREQIAKAERVLQNLERKLSELVVITDVVVSHHEGAGAHLKKAKILFEEKKYGEALGQARSAEALARNALSIIEKLPRISEETADGEIKERPPREEGNKICIQVYAPVCGADGKTYGNKCYAEVADVDIKHEGKCREALRPTPEIRLPKRVSTPLGTPIPLITPKLLDLPISSVRDFKIEADDNGFYPESVLTVARGSKVRIKFIVREKSVYLGGLDFRSSKFETDTVKPGGTVVVEFTADESFTFSSYWPLVSVKKATGKVVVK